MITVFTNGVWDMFHYGHYNMLKRAKDFGDFLLVGVATNDSCEKYKHIPHQSWKIRANSVKNLPFVDKVVKTKWSKDLSEEFYKEYNIDSQVQGDDISNFEISQKMGIFKKIGRTNGVSTSSIERTLLNNKPVGGGHMNDIRSTFLDNTPYIIKTSSSKVGKVYNISTSLNRIYNEYESIMAFREYLNNPKYIVNPICFDPDSYTIVFEKAPKHAKLLSSDMNNNSITNITYALAEMHNATLEKTELLKKHSNTKTFLDVKIKIQCLEVTKDKELSRYIHNFVKESLKIKKVLLHGDVAPKNIMVWDNEFLFIDFEESAYSDPAIDIGYLIAHFYLYGYVYTSRKIFDAYIENIRYSDDTFAGRINVYIGIFLLSRIDGRANDTNIKEEEKERIRMVAKEFILGDTVI